MENANDNAKVRLIDLSEYDAGPVENTKAK